MSRTPSARSAPAQTYTSPSGSVDLSTVRYLIEASGKQVRAEMEKHIQTELQAALTPIHADLAKLKDLPGTKTLIVTVVGTGFSILIGGLAILAFAADRFDGGMSASGALSQQATEQANTISQINAKLQTLTDGTQAHDDAQTGARPKPHK